MKIRILAICSHPEILQTIVRLLNNNAQWLGTGAINDEEALALFTNQEFDVVLLGAGTDADTLIRLKPAMQAINPSVKLIQHYGGGSGLLSAEIYEALNKEK
jgi:hypothetical protein